MPVGARFSAPVQTGPGAHPASSTMGTGSFPGIQRTGHGVDHPPPSVEVKERVELSLYSPCGPSWTVLGWSLLFTFIPVVKQRITVLAGEKFGPTPEDRLAENLGWRGMLLTGPILSISLPYVIECTDRTSSSVSAANEHFEYAAKFKQTGTRVKKKKIKFMCTTTLRPTYEYIRWVLAFSYLLLWKHPRPFAKLRTQTTPPGKILYACKKVTI